MKKLMCLAALLTMCACGREPPVFLEVKLANGQPGFMVDCKSWRESACLKFTNKVCHHDYNFVARNVGNHKNLLIISCQ